MWIMIVTVMLNGTSSTSTGIQFTNRQRCEFAIKEHRARVQQQAPAALVAGTCAPL